jgi:hypothetical protein
VAMSKKPRTARGRSRAIARALANARSRSSPLSFQAQRASFLGVYEACRTIPVGASEALELRRRVAEHIFEAASKASFAAAQSAVVALDELGYSNLFLQLYVALTFARQLPQWKRGHRIALQLIRRAEEAVRRGLDQSIDAQMAGMMLSEAKAHLPSPKPSRVKRRT